MAPLAAAPDQLRVVLNAARRQALYSLVLDITAHMRSQLELRKEEETQSGSNVTAAAPPPSSPSEGDGDPPPSYSLEDGGALSPAKEAETAGSSSSGAPQPPPGPRKLRRKPRQPSAALVKLRQAALKHLDSWRDETLSQLKEVLTKADDKAILDARRERAEELAAAAAAESSSDVPATKGEAEEGLLPGLVNSDSSATASKGNSSVQTAQGGSPGSLSSFQNLYRPLPTRLTTIPLADRQEVLSATMLVLLSKGVYSAYSRAFLCYLASALELPPGFLDREEVAVATAMVEAVQKADAEKSKKQGAGSGSGMDADAAAAKRRRQNQASRFLKVGLASVAGAAIIGVTGGLAAPVVAGALGGIMGSIGLGGIASFLGIFWMNGALVGTLFGAFGARMTGKMIDSYAKEVEDFKFLPLAEEKEGAAGAAMAGSSEKEGGEEATAAAASGRRLRVTIGINGWLTEEADVTRPWQALGGETEAFALRYEMRSLLALGAGLQRLVGSYAWSAIRAEILRRTVLATLWAALWPIHLVSMASSLDNPFSLARNRSEKAGRVLADALAADRVQGERPVTLVGYSLGARAIYACLRALAEKRAFGLVDSVVLIGAPVPSDPAHWAVMRSVVAGRLFNVYSSNDLILAFLYRATSAQLGIAGLEAVSCHPSGIGGTSGKGVERGDEAIVNLDLSAEVQGHTRYPDLIARILTRCGFPDVKGGEAEIEKEKEPAVVLPEEDGSGRPPDCPDGLLPGAKEQSPEKPAGEHDPRVKNVKEQKSDAAVRMEYMKGLRDDQSAQGPGTELPSSVADGNHVRGPISPVKGTDGTNHNTLVPSETKKEHENDDDKEGGEDDFSPRVVMLDNEDGMEILEPMPIRN